MKRLAIALSAGLLLAGCSGGATTGSTTSLKASASDAAAPAACVQLLGEATKVAQNEFGKTGEWQWVGSGPPQSTPSFACSLIPFGSSDMMASLIDVTAANEKDYGGSNQIQGQGQVWLFFTLNEKTTAGVDTSKVKAWLEAAAANLTE